MTPPERRHSAAAFLAREEQRTLQALRRSAAGLGEELLDSSALRAGVRAHPGLAVLASAAAGALLAPVLGRAARVLLPHAGSLVLSLLGSAPPGDAVGAAGARAPRGEGDDPARPEPAAGEAEPREPCLPR